MTELQDKFYNALKLYLLRHTPLTDVKQVTDLLDDTNIYNNSYDFAEIEANVIIYYINEADEKKNYTVMGSMGHLIESVLTIED